MIKVFLVEDEIIIRNGIKNSINWEMHGYDFVGEASDGELALPMILEKKPDILISFFFIIRKRKKTLRCLLWMDWNSVSRLKKYFRLRKS